MLRNTPYLAFYPASTLHTAGGLRNPHGHWLAARFCIAAGGVFWGGAAGIAKATFLGIAGTNVLSALSRDIYTCIEDIHSHMCIYMIMFKIRRIGLENLTTLIDQ